jgi:hypothetical protein
MSVTQQDAAEALRLVDEAGARSEMLRGYQSTAPHLILWGIIYALAYALSYMRPAQSNLIWIVLASLGSVGSVVAASLDQRERASSDGNGWLVIPALFLTFLGFIAASSAIMQPHDPRQVGAFVPLVVAVGYIVLGLGVGSRIALAGVALAALTLVGFFAFPGIFELWMAVVGGGTLILSGLWLRRV